MAARREAACRRHSTRSRRVAARGAPHGGTAVVDGAIRGRRAGTAARSRSRFLAIASGCTGRLKRILSEGADACFAPTPEDQKNTTVTSANNGSRMAQDHPRYPKNEGIFTPLSSEMLRTRKLGALPM